MSLDDFESKSKNMDLQPDEMIKIIFKVLIFRLESEAPVRYAQLVQWWANQE